MMMRISELDTNLWGLLIFSAWIVFLVTLYNLLSLWWVKRRVQSRVFAAFLLILSFSIMEMLLEYLRQVLPLFLEIPVIYITGAELVLVAMVIMQQLRKNKWLKRSLNAMSIKEAIDSLPTGLLFYRKDGMPRLVNERMNRICLEAFGVPLHNGVEFANLLYHGRSDAEEELKEQILILPDEKVYSFNRNTIKVKGHTYYELIASDITQEWKLKKKLEDQQKKANQINIRLKSLLDTIEYVTMSKELLQFKTTLHDNIGRSLLFAKRWILEKRSTDKEEILKIFQSNIRGLFLEEPEKWQSPYYVIEKEAQQLGIELVIDGVLPWDDESIVPIIDTAISVEMTNVLRHAEGKKVFIRVKEESKMYDIRLCNDGKAPEHRIRERGGLKNLRREVELSGGTMEIISEPEFVLTIRLPRKKERK